MNKVQQIIARFGGQSALAGALGIGQSTVAYWAKSGRIPTKWHAHILALAESNNIQLAAEELGPLVMRPVHRGKDNGAPLPVARYPGILTIAAGVDVPVYVLDDGRRVITRTGALNALADGKGGGNLESYLTVGSLRSYIPHDLEALMVTFEIKEVVNKTVKGFEADTFLDICKAYVKAREEIKLTEVQAGIAKRAGAFLAACSKIGLIALIDEATGYQYDRGQDALRFKLKTYLSDEMRKWEKTFPDELWREFGRLTNWKGSVVQRPKYWGKLVIEMVYECLDRDVAEWLKANAPAPRHGQNYHQWLNAQYGLKKLVEHIWMLVGMAKGCTTMPELREKMAAHFGREPFQYTFYLPPPGHRPLWNNNPGGSGLLPGHN